MPIVKKCDILGWGTKKWEGKERSFSDMSLKLNAVKFFVFAKSQAWPLPTQPIKSITISTFRVDSIVLHLRMPGNFLFDQ